MSSISARRSPRYSVTWPSCFGMTSRAERNVAGLIQCSPLIDTAWTRSADAGYAVRRASAIPSPRALVRRIVGRVRGIPAHVSAATRGETAAPSQGELSRVGRSDAGGMARRRSSEVLDARPQSGLPDPPPDLTPTAADTRVGNRHALVPRVQFRRGARAISFYDETRG